MKTILFSVALLFSLLLVGCKQKESSLPKETTLTGQAFIVTRGAESIKLGLVEVLLIEKGAVKEFIQQKQPAIDADILARRHEYESANDLLTTTNKVDEPLNLAVITETNYLAMLKLIGIRQLQLEEAEKAEPALRQKADESRLRYETGRSPSSLRSSLDALALKQNEYLRNSYATDIRRLSERITPPCQCGKTAAAARHCP